VGRLDEPAMSESAPGAGRCGPFSRRWPVFRHFRAERGRGAGGRSVSLEALAYTTFSVACTESGRLTAIGGMRRRRICIGLPQQGHGNAGRGLSGIGGRGMILSTRCSSAISPFLFGCRKP